MSERSRSPLGCRAVVAVAVVAVVAFTLSACTPTRAQLTSSSSSASAPPNATERQIIDAVNRFRGAHGLPGLAVNLNLEDKAHLWAAWMAGGNCGGGICHSNLSSGITVRWSLLEENVGMASPASNIAGVISGFERSPEHAANMLNSRITSIGVGVAYSGNTVYAAEEFMAP
jgi:uncharacterized protein YkwD